MPPVKRITQEEFEILKERMEPIGDETQPQRALRVCNEFPSDIISAYILHKQTNGEHELIIPINPPAEQNVPVIDIEPNTPPLTSFHEADEPQEIEIDPNVPGGFRPRIR